MAPNVADLGRSVGMRVSPFDVRPMPESESLGDDSREDDELFPCKEIPFMPFVKVLVDQSEKLCVARLLLNPPRAEFRILLPEYFPRAVPEYVFSNAAKPVPPLLLIYK